MELQGQSLILTVSVLTSLGFMLIGYDNGLMGGLVNTSAFKDTFDSPDADMIGVIVAIFESKPSLKQQERTLTYRIQLDASSVPSLQLFGERSLAVDAQSLSAVSS